MNYDRILKEVHMKVAKNAPGALRILWSEGIFLKGKKFEEVKAELEKRGYNFSDQNLAMALSSSKFLTRKGARGQFTYVQKHPYIPEEDNG